MAVTIDITMPSLHASQKKVVDSPARFRLLACGRRRWGKTRLGSALCIEVALNGGRAWWTAPSYPMSAVGWRLVLKLGLQIPGTRVNRSERSIMVPTGGEVKVRSADNPDSLRGEGLDFAVLDECAFMKEAAWNEAIRPALSDRQGRAMFISTPKGHNWFWRLWQRCGDDKDDEWEGWQLPTSDNPFIPDAEIEAARDSLPERIYQQEYEARFVDDSGGVFRRVMDAATSMPVDEPEDGHTYIAGVDLADKNDFTVAVVIDTTERRMVHMDRWNRTGYNALEDRLHAIYERWGLDVMVIESNSIGQPVIDSLMNRDMAIVPFATTYSSKQVLIQGLQSSFEHGNIQIVNDSTLINELISYEGERSTGGMFKYGAPSGMHDDCVMALALADLGCRRYADVGIEGENFLFN